MELFKEILAKILIDKEIVVTLPNLKFNAMEIAEIESYKALQKIKTIIDNDSLYNHALFYFMLESIR